MFDTFSTGKILWKHSIFNCCEFSLPSAALFPPPLLLSMPPPSRAHLQRVQGFVDRRKGRATRIIPWLLPHDMALAYKQAVFYMLQPLKESKTVWNSSSLLWVTAHLPLQTGQLEDLFHNILITNAEKFTLWHCRGLGSYNLHGTKWRLFRTDFNNARGVLNWNLSLHRKYLLKISSVKRKIEICTVVQHKTHLYKIDKY